ncbi:MAG: hypothetical protein KC649_06515, partial [Candidatus Omnitrophica bacterium]|nr:hypothetical protein [Candidatus Omnitrophota bacterium]
LSFREAWVHLYSYDPKTTASLFLLIYLYFLIRRNWFWTGIFLSCAVLCWQPAAMFILPLCIVLFNRSGKSILKNTAGLIFGALIPFVILFLLFLHWGALHEMIEATIVYPLKYHYGTEYNPLRSNVLKFMFRKTAYDSVFVLFGFICLTGSFVMNIIFKKRQELIERAPLFLCFGIICIWSFIDFKDYRDMYPLLPYACLGIALFFNEILATETHKRFAFTFIMLSAVLCSAFNPPVGASRQQKFERTLRQLNELVERHAPHRRIAAAGLPEIAAYLNLNLISRYAYWGGGHMLFIEDHVPGGVGQLKADIIKYDPEIIFVNKFYMKRYGRTLPRKYRRTMAVPGYPALINKNPNTEEWSQDADSQKSPQA